MRSWTGVSAALFTIGGGLFLYKVLVLDYPLRETEEPGTWRVELVISVTGRRGWAMVEVPLPRSTAYHGLRSEEVRSGRLQFSINEEDSARYGRWNGKLNGSTVLSYQATVAAQAYERRLPLREQRSSYPESVSAFLGESPGIQPSDPRFTELSRELLLDPSDKVKLVREIYQFVSREIGASLRGGPADASAVVEEGRGRTLGRVRLFCALARANDLPCRVVMGLLLADGVQHDLKYWNEAYVGGAWVPFDVAERRAEVLPPDRLVLSSRDPVAVRSSGTAALSYRFFVQSESQTYTELLQRRLWESDNPVDRLSLLFLPVQVQRNLRLLLLVPLGALVMTLLRNIVGVRTFGTFMPMLIALGMTATGLLLGSTVLAIIIGFALLSRVLIERFYLLLTARIAFVLTLIVALMVTLIVVGDRLGMSLGGVTAFPFVIMTMIVERISVSLEEEGLGNTLRRVGGTLVAIYVTYGILHLPELQTLFLVFPELIVVILALLVGVGRYTGFRLSELFRFRLFAAPPPGDGGMVGGTRGASKPR